jgi:hypothetical protein
MTRRRVPLPSPAMVVALCALFVALAGASYALTLPLDSVGPRQLRTDAVTSTSWAPAPWRHARSATARSAGARSARAAF